MKVILNEISSAADDAQNKLIESIQNDNSCDFKISNSLSDIDSSLVLIKHNDIPSFDPKEYKGKKWYLETGGGKSDKIPLTKSEAGEIAWTTFCENIEAFLSHIKNKEEITKEDIEVLYAIDPELERLLQRFEKLSPFANKLDKALDIKGDVVKDENGKELNIKEALNDYIKLKVIG